jgi:hypothetical protein
MRGICRCHKVCHPEHREGSPAKLEILPGTEPPGGVGRSERSVRMTGVQERFVYGTEERCSSAQRDRNYPVFLNPAAMPLIVIVMTSRMDSASSPSGFDNARRRRNISTCT